MSEAQTQADPHAATQHLPFETLRRSWTFQYLDADEFVRIEDVALWPRAVRAAHDYSSKQDPKRRFRARWSKADGYSIIRRMF